MRGFAGVQFALPEAVEKLRDTGSVEERGPFFVVAASDPANPYNLVGELSERDPLVTPRGGGAFLVVRDGRVAAAVEERGERVASADWLPAEERTSVGGLVGGLHRRQLR